MKEFMNEREFKQLSIDYIIKNFNCGIFEFMGNGFVMIGDFINCELRYSMKFDSCLNIKSFSINGLECSYYLTESAKQFFIRVAREKAFDNDSKNYLPQINDSVRNELLKMKRLDKLSTIFP